jgi:predicted aldo/keto reductase-like oxidoreductase
VAVDRKSKDERCASEDGQPSLDSKIGRRSFIQGSAAAAGLGAVGLGGLLHGESIALAETAGEKSRIRRYKTLGKTGIEVSDISFGAGSLSKRHLLNEALERGINYFDTAEGYPVGFFGVAEKQMGIALGSRRKDVVISTKSQIKANENRQQIMKKLEGSLKRLQTDYVDIYFNQAINELARLKNGEWLEFVETAKKQGKIRFSGMSGHGGQLIECLDYAIDNNLVDVILAAHNFGQDPAFYQRFLKHLDIVAIQVDLPRVFAKAHAKGIGVIAMKTLMGAKLNDLRPYEHKDGTYSQAAFRWVLENPNVDALIVSMRSEETIDEYVKASGTAKLTAHDTGLLKRYALGSGLSYCRHGCDACVSSCPDDVPISELLRARMYATDYGDLDQARGTYLELGAAASPCLTCTNQTCLGACPVGIDIPSRTRTLPDLLG